MKKRNILSALTFGLVALSSLSETQAQSSLNFINCRVNPETAVRESRDVLTRLQNTQFSLVRAIPVLQNRQRRNFTAARALTLSRTALARISVARRIRQHQRVNNEYKEVADEFIDTFGPNASREVFDRLCEIGSVTRRITEDSVRFLDRNANIVRNARRITR